MAGYLGSTPVPQATQHRESFTCTEGQTSFATAGYTPQFLDVFLNGSHLSPADFVATNSSDVVLVVAASADDVCDIVSYTPFEVAGATFTGTTTVDVATVGGTLGVAGLVSPAAGITVVGSTTVDDILLTAVALPGTGNPSIALRNSDNVVYHQSGSADQIVFLDSGQDTMALFHDDAIQFNIDNSVAFDINGAGEVTKPLQPSFHAVRSGNQTGYNANSTANHTLVYNAVAYDIGSNFNTSTGRFTAPVDGTYQFVACCYCTSGTSMTQAWFVVGNGRAEGTDVVYQNAATDFPYQAITIKLDAGDVIGWHPYVSGASNVTITANNNHTWFKGTLLH